MSTGTLEVMGTSWLVIFTVACTAFGLGVVIGVISERHKEEVMGYTRNARVWFDRWAPALYLFVGILACIGILISAAATVTNGRQDAERAAEAKARDEEQAKLLDCFDQYAAAQSGSSQAVRAASVERDAAQGERDDALLALVTLIVGNASTPPVDQEAAREVFLETATHLRDASQQLDKASAALELARRNNPVPEPPSTFCNDAS